MNNVATWLMGRQHVASAVSVTVQIGPRTYSAARYTDDRNGETRLYVLGEMPPLHNKMRGICYRTHNSEYDWHLVAVVSAKLSLHRVERGPSVRLAFPILAQWSPVENWAADQCERKPYRRLPMTIQEGAA